jgi:hypothetical protein
MLNQIVEYFSNLFTGQGQTTYGSELERYIVSKNPGSAAEIDHWTKQFDQNQTQRSWL